jgi:hypothetical protein
MGLPVHHETGYGTGKPSENLTQQFLGTAKCKSTKAAMKGKRNVV